MLLSTAIELLSAALLLLPPALLRALVVAVTSAAAPAATSAFASFALPAVALLALLGAGLRLRLTRYRLLSVSRGRFFTLARLLRWRIGPPDIGAPLPMAFLVGTPAPAVAVPLPLLLWLLPAFWAWPVSAVLLAVGFPMLAVAVIALVPPTAAWPSLALLRCRRWLRRCSDDFRSGVRRPALQPAEELADDGRALGRRC